MTHTTAPAPAPLPEELRERLSRISLPTVGHFLENGFVDPEIRAQVPGAHCIGGAVTVRISPPDSTMVHIAAGLLRPGDALVIDLGGDRRHAPVGELVALACAEAGASAIVIDGFCTDIREIREIGLPVFARGTTLLTTKLLGLQHGTVNQPISCGGVSVHPGDIVCGDDNGVLIMRADALLSVLDRVEDSDAAEPAIRDQLRSGGTLPELSGAAELLADPRGR